MRTQTRKYVFNAPVSTNDVQKCACVKNNLNPHDMSALCSIGTLYIYSRTFLSRHEVYIVYKQPLQVNSN